MLPCFVKLCRPKIRLNKLRIVCLSPGHLNPRLSARVIGSKIGEVVEVVVDLVDNGQCGLKKKTVLQTRWSGFFVFMTPFHTSYMYIVHTYPPELPAFVVFALGSQPSDWIARLWPFCCFVSESSATSLKTWLLCLCPPDRMPPFSFPKKNFWNYGFFGIG